MSEQTLVERLRQQRITVGKTWYTIMFIEAADRIEELEAIVEKLPKTVDGVSVVPGMRLFCTHNRTVTVQSIDQPDDPDDDDSFITVWEDSGKINATDFVYSTRSAAEAAANEGAGR